MRPDLVRKTISGLEEFHFAHVQRFFFVKNMSTQPCYIGFEPDATVEESIKVMPNTGEEISLCYAKTYDSRKIRFDTLYVRGEGEIEIQGMEIWIED